MSTTEDIPAFPYRLEIKGPQDDPFEDGNPVPAGKTRIHTFGGMYLRDYFAAKAMQAIVCDPHHVTYKREGYEAVSGYAYALADAMLEARSKV